MKVVIPTTYEGHKKLRFLSPRCQYSVPDHNIWGKETSDDPFQVSKLKSLLGWPCGQHELC